MSKKLSKRDIQTLKRDGVYDTVKNLEVKVGGHTRLSTVPILFTAAIHNWIFPSVQMGETFFRLGLGLATLRIAFNADVVEHCRGTFGSSVLATALTQLPKNKRKSNRK